VKRQAELQQELAQISAALGTAPTVAIAAEVTAPDPAPAPAATPAEPKRRKRAKNELSLVDAVLTVTKDKPLPKAEILAAIGKIGYKFTAKDPLNSLNTTLYTSKKLKNFGKGVFGPK
ncbi:MAG: hypothetical protein KIT22_12525, partial [Verrucomicrobiae bacterium]|nr:hypothetical protein [Verrucomicrobiae bacterium]